MSVIIYIYIYIKKPVNVNKEGCHNIKVLQFQKIVLTNAVGSMKKDLELMSVLSGIEVQSFVLDDHCCIVYHMQHPTEYEIKHGLRIELKNGMILISLE